MAKADELTVEEQLRDLDEVAESLGLKVTKIDATTFVVAFTARNGDEFWAKVLCDGFPATPPAWHWFNPATGELDSPEDTPKGGNFFHGHGVICAPWNRLSYKDIDSRGPHNDWTIGSWQTNPKNGACRTLSAMALRVHTEFMTNYERRMAA